MKKTKSTTGDGVDASGFLSLDEIKELIELIHEKQFNEFELQRGDFRLRLLRGGKSPADTVVEIATAPPVPAEAKPAAPPSVMLAPPIAPTPPEEALHIMNSPIVGTFYRAASATAESFVKLGDAVEAGKTLCIIEAMKLMNEIQADASGAIVKIFVENGQPVEYGQALFGIKTQ